MDGTTLSIFDYDDRVGVFRSFRSLPRGGRELQLFTEVGGFPDEEITVHSEQHVINLRAGNTALRVGYNFDKCGDSPIRVDRHP